MKDNFNPMNEAVNEPEAPDTATPKDPPRGKAAVKAHLESKYTPEQIEQQRIMWELRSTFQKIGPAALEEMQHRAVNAASLAEGNANSPDYDPALDPASPAFDFLKWKKQTGINSLDELAALIVFALGNIQAQLEASSLRIGPTSKETAEAIRELKKITDSDEFQILKMRVLSLSESEGTQESDLANPEEVEQAIEGLPRINSKAVSQVLYPLDKVNGNIWNFLEPTDEDENGNLNLQIDTASQGAKAKGKEAIIAVFINFDGLDGLELTKQLTTYDKRVYVAAAALYLAGNETFTFAQIYNTMGNKGRPSAAQLKKIDESITKMGATRVAIDNKQEVKINRRYGRFDYDSPILPFERIRAYINNKFSEGAIHLYTEPPLIKFAADRGQITTFSKRLLESPQSKTDANLRLEDYLLDRIGHMKSAKSKAPRKMLYSTIFERCGITEKKQKQRAPAKIRAYLEYYKTVPDNGTGQPWIAGFSEDSTGVTIIL